MSELLSLHTEGKLPVIEKPHRDETPEVPPSTHKTTQQETAHATHAEKSFLKDARILLAKFPYSTEIKAVLTGIMLFASSTALAESTTLSTEIQQSKEHTAFKPGDAFLEFIKKIKNSHKRISGVELNHIQYTQENDSNFFSVPSSEVNLEFRSRLSEEEAREIIDAQPKSDVDLFRNTDGKLSYARYSYTDQFGNAISTTIETLSSNETDWIKTVFISVPTKTLPLHTKAQRVPVHIDLSRSGEGIMRDAVEHYEGIETFDEVEGIPVRCPPDMSEQMTKEFTSEYTNALKNAVKKVVNSFNIKQPESIIKEFLLVKNQQRNAMYNPNNKVILISDAFFHPTDSSTEDKFFDATKPVSPEQFETIITHESIHAVAEFLKISEKSDTKLDEFAFKNNVQEEAVWTSLSEKEFGLVGGHPENKHELIASTINIIINTNPEDWTDSIERHDKRYIELYNSLLESLKYDMYDSLLNTNTPIYPFLEELKKRTHQLQQVKK